MQNQSFDEALVRWVAFVPLQWKDKNIFILGFREVDVIKCLSNFNRIEFLCALTKESSRPKRFNTNASFKGWLKKKNLSVLDCSCTWQPSSFFDVSVLETISTPQRHYRHRNSLSMIVYIDVGFVTPHHLFHTVSTVITIYLPNESYRFIFISS